MRKRLAVLGILWACSGAALAQMGGGGPSILSRGGPRLIGSGRESFGITPFVNVQGIYDNGLLLAPSNGTGEVRSQSQGGVETTFGAAGSKTMKRSAVGLSYIGNIRRYSGALAFNGSDHSLSLEYANRIARRWTLMVRPSAGTMSRSVGGLLGAQGLVDPTGDALGRSSLFDNRFYYGQTSADLIFQKSSRLSFGFGGDGYVVRRQSRALVGVNAAIARGNVAYRWTRRQTFFADYSRVHYDYDRAFGTTDADFMGGGYALRLGQTMEANVRVGVYRLETLGQQVIPLRPEIAAILGRTSGLAVLHDTQWLNAVDASLRRNMRTGSLSVSFSRGINPGNGLLLTSNQTALNATYSYNRGRNWSADVNGGLVRLSSLSQQAGNDAGVLLGSLTQANQFQTYYTGASFNYTASRSVGLTARYDYRTFNLPGSTIEPGSVVGFDGLRGASRVSVGLSYNPGRISVPWW